MANILIVDDELNMCRILAALLRDNGYDAGIAHDGNAALRALKKKQFNLIISDLKMPGMGGLGLLNESRKHFPDIPFIIMTAHGTIETAVEAMKNGAYDYITKPFENDEILLNVKKSLLFGMKLGKEIHIPPGSISKTTIKKIVGSSGSIKKIFNIMEQVARTDSTVLITGETGTGKELIARDIHQKSNRASNPFIAVNCGALSESLIESELFGHEKGAFTGAVIQRPGRFELANTGTIFLDEIGEMSKSAQVKLLRVLQEKTFERVGGVNELKTDVRVISATNRDLQGLIQKGDFRKDLFYRLNVVRIDIPPLRERKTDIPEMIEHFLEKYNRKFNKKVTKIKDVAVDELMRYNWPGNIRELENVIERSVLFSKTDTIEEIQLSGSFTAGNNKTPETGTLPEIIKSKTSRIERELIEETLKKCSGNRTRAAELLGISRKTLQNKLKEYGL